MEQAYELNEYRGLVHIQSGRQGHATGSAVAARKRCGFRSRRTTLRGGFSSPRVPALSRL